MKLSKCKNCGLCIKRSDSSITDWRHTESGSVSCAAPGNAEPHEPETPLDPVVDVKKELYEALLAMMKSETATSYMQAQRAIKAYEAKGRL